MRIALYCCTYFMPFSDEWAWMQVLFRLKFDLSDNMYLTTCATFWSNPAQNVRHPAHSICPTTCVTFCAGLARRCSWPSQNTCWQHLKVCRYNRCSPLISRRWCHKYQPLLWCFSGCCLHSTSSMIGNHLLKPFDKHDMLEYTRMFQSMSNLILTFMICIIQPV